MSTTRSRASSALVLATACALAIGVLGAAPAPAAEYAGLGCYTDPTGDTGGVPEVDLLAMCVNYDDDVTTVEVRHATTFDISNSAWQNEGTALSAIFSTDADEDVEVRITLRFEGGQVIIDRTDGSGAPLGDACPSPALELTQDGSEIHFPLSSGCFGGATAVRAGVVFAYQPDGGGAPAVDRAPDALSSPPMPQGDAPPFCDTHSEDGDDVVVARLRCGGVITGTEPITQAVAVSQFVFNRFDTPEFDPYLGRWAVIVRNDNYADALAGSSLGFGQGPLLFTPSPTSGPALVPPQDPDRLAAASEQELLRTVPRGLTVYVLGGTAAISDGVMAHLQELGYNPVRLAGSTREETAAVVARETRRLVQGFVARNPGFPDTNMVLIANNANWPDAVLAGQVGALWGMPILLNPATGPGHPATLAALEEIRPNAIQFIGGSGVITSDTLNAIRDFAIARGFGVGPPGETANTSDRDVPWRQFCARSPEEPFWSCRQGGATRLNTAAAVSQFGREMIQRFGGEGTLIPDTEVYASGVPLAGDQSSDNYAYVLAASMMSGRFGGAVFLPTDQPVGNQRLTDTIKESVCDIDRGKDTNGDGLPDTPFIHFVELVALMADTDKLSDAFGEEIRALIEGGCPPEFQQVGPRPSLATAD